MADSHGETNPDAAPMRQDIKENFSNAQVALAVALGLIATIAGVVFGVLLAND